MQKINMRFSSEDLAEAVQPKLKKKRQGGTVKWVAGQKRKSLFDRFTEKITPAENSCWLWQANILPNSYGTFTAFQKTQYAHRFAYELFRAEIPKGLTLDHRCRTRHCVNPFHLFPETRGNNVIIGDTIAARNAAKTHCPKGHPYSDENTYRPKRGGRMCNECRRIRDRAKSQSESELKSTGLNKIPF